MSKTQSFENAKIVVLGGTGAQGHSVVKALANKDKYQISVLTRDPASEKSKALILEFPQVKLIAGSYLSEGGLRAAFVNQDVVYFNVDSFSVGEPFEYFWTFRAYEIAVQAKIKWFFYAGAPNRFEHLGMAEQYRNSHNIVGSRLAEWITIQPVNRLPWTIITGGVYAEMLKSLLAPAPRGDEYVFKVPMNKDSIIPMVPLENYGKVVEWSLENHKETVGKYISAAPFEVTFVEVAKSVEEVTGKKTTFFPITVDEWMAHISSLSPHIRPDYRLPFGASEDDATSFTFKKTFGAWWNMWRDNKGFAKRPEFMDYAEQKDDSRLKTLKDWMIASNYDPSAQRVRYA